MKTTHSAAALFAMFTVIAFVGFSIIGEGSSVKDIAATAIGGVGIFLITAANILEKTKNREKAAATFILLMIIIIIGMIVYWLSTNGTNQLT